jgi:hypothetical protein
VEQLETEALGWTDRRVYVRLPDSRWRFTSIWLDASDVTRRKAANPRGPALLSCGVPPGNEDTICGTMKSVTADGGGTLWSWFCFYSSGSSLTWCH